MSIGRRVLWLVPLIVGLFAPPAAWACSCILPDADQLVARAAILFEGAMVGTGRPHKYSGCEDANAPECVQHVRAIFRVDRVLKEELGKTVAIRYAPPGGFGCGPAFRMNEPALVAVNFYPDGSYIIADICAMGVRGYGLELSEVTEALERYRKRLEQP